MQEMWIPMQLPISSDRLVLRVMDEDKVVDEIAGSLYFKLSQLMDMAATEGGFTKWMNLLGAPLNRKGEFSDLMNDNPEYASTWKGRILMQLECVDTDQPEMKVQAIDPQIQQDCIDQGYFEEKYYDFMAEVGQGICLPGQKKYKVQVRLGDYTMTTGDPCEYENKGYNRWSERIGPSEGYFKSTFHSVESFHRVFVYLLDGDSPICYWIGRIQDFMDPNP